MGLTPDLITYDAVGLSELVKSKEISVLELVEQAIERAEKVNPDLNFISNKEYDRARDMAKQGVPNGVFEGVPFLLKDMGVEWAGVKRTNGSVAYKDYTPETDCWDGEKLKEAGLVLLATSTAPEGAWSGATESTLQGDTLNPWDTTRTPGGSSGGSAAAIAARVVPIATGSDGGGSLRIPASFAGIVGLKPSRGRIQFGPKSADGQNGYITRGCMSISIRDSAAFLDIMRGNYPGDYYICSDPSDSYLSTYNLPPKKLRIGMTTSCPSGIKTWQPAIDAVHETAKLCEMLGHSVEEMEFQFDYEQFAKTVTRLEAVHHACDFENLRTYLGRYPNEDETMPFWKKSADFGNSISTVQYAQDIATTKLLSREIAAEVSAFDVVLTPTMPVKPPKIGWLNMVDTPLDEYNQDLCDYILPFGAPFNCSGQPAISLPLGFCQNEGLPAGVQFVGQHGDEETLLRLSAQLEQAAPWRDRLPPINAISD